ncbi:hypothetical protein [Mangrovicella endophytica]|uniref:hypothetical protein n=1 Tax=Mangrovicella endophytica TaxID=2066697 RepID=UPI000C9E6092|nr:hypothetical protein [Mangrovicella endophytica]
MAPRTSLLHVLACTVAILAATDSALAEDRGGGNHHGARADHGHSAFQTIGRTGGNRWQARGSGRGWHGVAGSHMRRNDGGAISVRSSTSDRRYDDFEGYDGYDQRAFHDLKKARYRFEVERSVLHVRDSVEDRLLDRAEKQLRGAGAGETGITYRGVDDYEYHGFGGAAAGPGPIAAIPTGGVHIIDVAAERLDRRPIGLSGIDVINTGGARIIRIKPDYSLRTAAAEPRPSAGYLQPWSREWLRHCMDAHADFATDLGTFTDSDGRQRFCAAD